jgi:porin
VRAGQFAGQDFYGSQLFAPSFIFEPLQYAFGNLYASTYENFDPPSTPAAEVRVIPAVHFYTKYMVSAAVRNRYNYNPTGFVPQFRGMQCHCLKSAIARQTSIRRPCPG